MKLQDETLKEELSNVALDDVIKFIDTITVDVFKCPVCKKSNFSFVIGAGEPHMLTAFYSPSLSGDSTDEYCVHYKMCCESCSSEINLNALTLIKRIKEMKSE
ncbi:TPA: hypothetical protein I8W54_004101 [Morganella morganii]|nr:hypothetical protein [Morganella morganii]